MRTRQLMYALAVACTFQTAMAVYSVGDVPSDFTCTDWDGNSWNLYDQRGKVVLINFGAIW